MKHCSAPELAKALSDELEIPLEMSSDLSTLDEWNSINILFVLARIEQDFGVKLSAKELHSLRTIPSISDSVLDKQNHSK